jgi:acetate kinase
MEPPIGVINAGSSSLKFSFYEGERRLLGGQVEGIGAHPSASAVGPDGEAIPPPQLHVTSATVPSDVLPTILRWARERLGNRRLSALGHRVVHRGLRHSRPACMLAAALGGLDGLVFTAGVGENAAPVRSAICRACDWLGLELEEAANRANEHCISTPESRVSACVIKTDENLMIARHARALVSAAAPGAR